MTNTVTTSKIRFNPHLSFDGDCAAAFKHYEAILGGKVLYAMTYGESPMSEQTPADCRGRILHGTFALDDLVLTGADTLPGQYRKPQGVWLLLRVDATDRADQVFAALAAGGVVEFPIAETFWARRFGMVVDRFGTPWIIQSSDG